MNVLTNIDVQVCVCVYLKCVALALEAITQFLVVLQDFSELRA